MTDLAPYTGPGGYCPKCGAAGVQTEYHWAGGCWAPDKTCGRESPCKSHSELSAIEGSEHLCRVCKNCGYGWVEACKGSDDTGQLGLVPDGQEADPCPG